MYEMNDPAQMRQPFFDAWKKFELYQPLTDLEKQLVQVIQDHPEYHAIFTQPDYYQHKNYLAETDESNPFLHLGLHLAVRDQVNTDCPAGIREIFQSYCLRLGGALEAEHKIMECIAEELWRLLRYGESFNAERYLQKLKEYTSHT